jgi:hypothetical protein
MTQRTIDGDDDERGDRELRRKKKRRAVADAQTAGAYEPTGAPTAPAARWTSSQVLLALAFGVVTGGVAGYALRGGSPGAATSEATPAGSAGPRADGPAAAPAAGADKFGRPPGDEHHGHDHPVQQQHGAPPGAPPGAAPGAPPAAAPGPDGKDSFGRAKGDEHFGHTHP